MTAAEDRVGVYAKELNKYFEISNGGDVLGEWKLPETTGRTARLQGSD